MVKMGGAESHWTQRSCACFMFYKSTSVLQIGALAGRRPCPVSSAPSVPWGASFRDGMGPAPESSWNSSGCSLSPHGFSSLHGPTATQVSNQQPGGEYCCSFPTPDILL